MSSTGLNSLSFENVTIKKLSIFDGYEINFSVENQSFQFMVGNTKSPFPLNVKHVFKEQEICHRCGKMTYPSPIGQQLCKAFQIEMKELLIYFQRNYSF